MGEHGWISGHLYYNGDDIYNILEYGHSVFADDGFDGIGERVDVERAMKALGLRKGLHWENVSYQLIADYLNGGR